MIVQKDLLSMEFYKKAVYTGSEGNMRFRIIAFLLLWRYNGKSFTWQRIYIARQPV